ncbi:MAG: MerR family transcriptional regulator [Oscillospiraceae bacterium]|nr:MerR family transcriptional regulator [Oscillospiraceae bacterium]
MNTNTDHTYFEGVDASRLISARDFSKITKVPVSTLKYYDEIGLFKPLRRGENGYRYYAPQQVVTVNFIRVLTQCGVPLKTISEMEKNRNPKDLLQVLHKHEIELDREMRSLRERYSVLHVFVDMIFTGLLADESVFAVEDMPATPLLMGAEIVSSNNTAFYESFVRFIAQTPRVNLSFPVGGLFKDMASYLSAPSEPTRFFSIDPFGDNEKHAGRYLVGYTRGFYGQMNDLPEKMAAYAEERDMQLIGAVYTIYLHDEVSISDPENYLLQVSVQVKEKTRR